MTSRAGTAIVGRSLQSATGNGWFTFTVNPTNGQTIIINSVTWTFVTSGATGNQTNIGANLAATLVQLQSDLTASANTSISAGLYAVVSGTILMIRQKIGQPGIFGLTAGTSSAVPSGTTTTASPPKLYEFQFNILQGYVLEFGDLYLRFIFQGGYVVETGVAITGATQANPCQISVAGTPFANGDWVFFSGVGGMTQLNGQTAIVSGAASGHFTLTTLNGSTLDSTAYTAFTSGGTVSRIYTVASPYRAVDLPYLKAAESADLLSLACSNPTNSNEYPPYELVRLGGASWTLNPAVFDPVISPPASATAVGNNAAPTNGLNASFAYEVTAVDKKGNESVASPIATCRNADLAVEGGTITVSWTPVSTALSYNIYRAPPSADTGGSPPTQINPVPPGSIFGLVGSAYGTRFADSQSVADLTQTPPVHQNPFARGQILSVSITSGGAGQNAVTYALTTSNGINFVGTPIVINGSLVAFTITNPGANFAPGDSIAFNGAGFASGAITFASNPSNGDTVTLNGVTLTFVTTVTAGNQIPIAGALQATLTNLVFALSISTNTSLNVAGYSLNTANTALDITYLTAGTAGNAYTLAASAATPSGTNLTGGSGSGSGSTPSGTLNIGPTSGTYPGVVNYFQQRRFFANSLNNPDTFWASQTGLYSNFDTAIPVKANDSITASPWTEQVNGIQWLIAMPGGLIAMTGERAWQIIGQGSYQLNVQPITPSTTQAQPQAFNGCSATVQPLVIEHDVLYVESINNSVVRDLAWNFWVNIYTGTDLTILSSHLFTQTTCVQWTWSRQPYYLAWYVRSDGTLLSLTYLKEQEVSGWARHDTLGNVVSVATVTEPPVDAVYWMVLRFPSYAPFGVYLSERMDNRLWQSVEDAYAVDSGVSNPLVFPAAGLIASAPSGSGVTFTANSTVFNSGQVGQVLRMNGGIATITGFTNNTQLIGTWNLAAATPVNGVVYAPSGAWSITAPVTSLVAQHLAGMTLSGLADGVPLSGLVAASNGTVTLPFAASNVKVGLPFLPQLQTPWLNGPEPTIQGRRKIIPAVTIRVAASGVFQVGTNQPDGPAQNPPNLGTTWTTGMATASLAQLNAKTYTSPGGQTVTQLVTGDERVVVAGNWSKPGQVAVQQPNPLSLEVLAAIPETLPGDLPEAGYPREQDQQGGGQQAPPANRLAGARGGWQL